MRVFSYIFGGLFLASLVTVNLFPPAVVSALQFVHAKIFLFVLINLLLFLIAIYLYWFSMERKATRVIAGVIQTVSFVLISSTSFSILGVPELSFLSFETGNVNFSLSKAGSNNSIVIISSLATLILLAITYTFAYLLQEHATDLIHLRFAGKRGRR